jgi:hypothetical protein
MGSIYPFLVRIKNLFTARSVAMSRPIGLGIIVASVLTGGMARAQYYYNNPWAAQQAYAQQFAAQQAYARQLATQQAYAQQLAAQQAYARQLAVQQAYAQQLAAQQAYAQQLAAQQAYAQRQEAARAQQQLATTQVDENLHANAAQVIIAGGGAALIDARVQRVISQLQSYSGKSFRVVPAQTGNWGQAHAGGVILFDLSSAVQDINVLAFRLAHEWGHEDLGRSPNVYQPFGNARLITSPTQNEDEADEYAGKLMRMYGYDIDVVKRTLMRYPTIAGDSHSGGAERAQLVQCGADEVATSSSDDK